MTDLQDAEHWTLSTTEAALFGAAATDKRTERAISLEGLSEGARRTEAWLAAVERGDVALTREMAVRLGFAFKANGAFFDVDEVVREIRQKPFGPAAGRLRTLLRLNTPAPLTSGLPPTRAMPDLLSAADRLLILGPWLLLSALLLGVLQALSLSIGDSAATTTIASSTAQLRDALAPTIAVGTVTAVLGLRAIESLTRGVSDLLRSPKSRAAYRGIASDLTANGLHSWQPKSVHRADDIIDHLLPRYRQQFQTASFRAHFAERTVPALSLGLIAAIAAAGVALAQSDNGVSTAGPISGACFLLILLVAAFREAGRSAYDMRSAICRGFGYAVDDRTSLDDIAKAAAAEPHG